MEVTTKNISVQKTARYYVAGNLSAQTKNIWFVIHGYGQLAENFIQQFDFLLNNETIVIAPEGLSRFYTTSAGNVTGASWMTKEDRGNEIMDYNSYLDSVLDEVRSGITNTIVKINVLGFSQGVHTAARWFIGSSNKFDGLYLCSSDFPRDADFEKLRTKLQFSKMFYIYGDSDGIIPQASFEKSIRMLKEKNIDFETSVFEGKHIIHSDTIKKLAGI